MRASGAMNAGVPAVLVRNTWLLTCEGFRSHERWSSCRTSEEYIVTRELVTHTKVCNLKIKKRNVSQENLHFAYRKVPKFSGTRILCCNLPKIQEERPNLRVFLRKGANGIANSDRSSRSSLIWVCTVCPDLSVRKLWIITVCLQQRCRSDARPHTLFSTTVVPC